MIIYEYAYVLKKHQTIKVYQINTKKKILTFFFFKNNLQYPMVLSNMLKLMHNVYTTTNFFKKDFFFFFYYINYKSYYNNISVLNFLFFENYAYKPKLLISSKKYSKYYCSQKTPHAKFVNLLVKHGLKLRYINIYSQLYLSFYKNFFFFDEFLTKLFPLYSSFYNLSKSNTIFYVIDYFYQLLFNQYNYIFFVKVAEISKKLKKRKKLKKKYNIYYSYLKPLNRYKWLLKQIIFSNTLFNFKKFQSRLYYTFISLLLTPEKNFLKDQQIKIYKNILKVKKNT